MLAWQFDIFLYQCAEEYMLKNKCGSFFEVHRPFDSTVLESKQVTQLDAGKLFLESVSTHGLCTGKYEVFFL